MVTAFGVCLASLGVKAQEPPDSTSVVRLDGILVVAPTPLPGAALPLRQIARNVQVALAGDLESNIELTGALRSSFAGLSLNNQGGNPFQPDLGYRGFRGSPVLGLPQGISVYLDGVRVNEIFGDVVNWELIPESALSSVTLMPGSDPLFGQNTLGGALSARTKSGFTTSGERAEASLGSFGGLAMEVESAGMVTEQWAYFGTGSLYREDGWRDFSESSTYDFFGKLERQGGAGRVGLGLLMGSSRLRGNGGLPIDLFRVRPQSVFTHEDATRVRRSFGRVSRRPHPCRKRSADPAP